MSDKRDVSASEAKRSEFTDDVLDLLVADIFFEEPLDKDADQSRLDADHQFRTFCEQADAALDSLGSSEELVDKVTGKTAGGGGGCRQLELPTMREDAERETETVAERPDVRESKPPAEEFKQMKAAYRDFQQRDRVSFFSDYRKLGELGHGGQGVVFLVESRDDFSAARALKVFSPETYDDSESYVADMQRIQPIAALINRDSHDDLLGVDWFGQQDGVYYMLMQYINGFDLRRLLQPELLPHLKKSVSVERWEKINDVVYSANGAKQLALQPAIAVYIIERVLRGLDALHRRGVVHGDIKPANIMLNASGSVKIIDIGSAFEVESRPNQHYVTPAYAAPEFLVDASMTRQSDLASVGYMLIELLSGKPILEAAQMPDESTRTISGPWRQDLLEVKNSLPDRLEEILPANVRASTLLLDLCRGLIEPDLSKRYPTAADSIVDRKGTYEFNKDLILSDLGVCNFQEVSQWLSDVKLAELADAHDALLPNRN